jgi:hypothetical protein
VRKVVEMTHLATVLDVRDEPPGEKPVFVPTGVADAPRPPTTRRRPEPGVTRQHRGDAAERGVRLTIAASG